MTAFSAHVDGIVTRGSDDYVGSPMYTVIAEHQVAVLAVLALLAVAWFARRRAGHNGRCARWMEAYGSLDLLERTAWWMITISAVVHVGLVLGHEPSGYSLLYLTDAVLLGIVARRLWHRRSWRRWGRLVLVASLLGYTVSGFGGEPPDQVGLATKLAELLALAIALDPRRDTRIRRMAGSAAIVSLTLIVGVGSWAGAFQSGDGGHHLGETPTPGVLLPVGEDRQPTTDEVAEAADLHAQVSRAIAKYADPAVAAADGYPVDDMYGTDFHASNAAYQADGRILDPERPETLVYAITDRGPVLLGAMFEMEGFGEAGPTPGGPLTVWHAHDHVCFSLTPPALTGLTSPFGGCPLGSITIARTPEMIHVWTLPGVPEPFGDLDEEWLAAHIGA